MNPYRNPLPIPGTRLLADAAVTPAMSKLAQDLLHDQRWPMHSQTGAQAVDGRTLVARLEWHPPEPSIDHWHRGVTLYEVTGALQCEGIDLSNYQPTVDWTLVRGAKDFAFIKATEGVHTVDATFAKHWDDAFNAGLLTGAYHFFHPELDAAAQADHFLETVGDERLQWLPPVLDAEIPHGTSPVEVLRGVLTWVQRVTDALKRRPLLYTMPGFWNTLPVQPGQMAACCDLWVAHWDVARPLMPKGWTDWMFWQYSATAGVAGVGEKMDVCRFNGTHDQMVNALLRG